MLEKDFQLTTECVTISEDNYNTYSVSYLKLLFTISSEIDVMLEFLAKLYTPTTKETGFGYSKVLLKNEPDIKALEIKLRNEELLYFHLILNFDMTYFPIIGIAHQIELYTTEYKSFESASR